MIPRQSYEQIAAELRELSAWLVSIGVTKKFDRIHVHMANISRLIEAREKGRLRELVDQDGQEQLLWSLVEAVEFIDAWRALRDLKADILHQKIQDALEGPATPLEESPVSNLGRNTMFELNLAGRIHSRGISLQLLKNPDILCNFGALRLNIHCKRPLTETKIPRSVSDARKQVRRDTFSSRDDHARGLIAISLSRVLNPGSKLLVVHSQDDIEGKLAEKIGAVRERYLRVEQRVSEDRIIGFIYHLISPAFIDDMGLLVAADQIVLVPLSHTSDADRAVLRDLAAFMK